MTGEELILEVKNLRTAFATDVGLARAVDGVSFKVKKGRTLGVVGESGCGKSVTALSLMRLLPKPAGRIEGGEVLFRGQDLLRLPAAEIRKVRGDRISMIFQDPMTALNPVHTIGHQLAESYYLHRPEMDRRAVRAACLDLLKRVGIASPEQRLNDYPHQLSGGMRQRVMIAIALACEPDILIADEPTTALDVTIQAQILELMQTLQESTGMAIIFITHDLGVVAEMCDDVAVMYAGKIVEQASVRELFRNPRHPYTKGLLASIPRLATERKTRLTVIEGMVPGIMDLPAGCRFQNRCVYVQDACRATSPPLTDDGDGRQVACFRWRDI